MPPGMEPLALFRTLAHNPRVLRRVQRGGLLDPGSISLRFRELVILRTCALCGADYEWGVHATLFAGGAGLDESQRRAGPEDAGWTTEERLVLELCDELHHTSTVGDALWSRLADSFSHAQLVEVVTLAGLYHAISFVVNAFEVAPEPWPKCSNQALRVPRGMRKYVEEGASWAQVLVAEGVETKAELGCLIDLGCDVFQGFYFARPGSEFPVSNVDMK